jgi:hypothetical protein
VAGALIWVGHPSDRLGVALEVIFKAALFFWAPVGLSASNPFDLVPGTRALAIASVRWWRAGRTLARRRDMPSQGLTGAIVRS